MSDIIKIDGKKYTHRSGFPVKGDIVMRPGGNAVDEVMYPGDCSRSQNIRVILTPYIEPGPWDSGPVRYGRVFAQKVFGVIEFHDEDNGVVELDPRERDTFLLDAVKQAQSMGIIKSFEE